MTNATRRIRTIATTTPTATSSALTAGTANVDKGARCMVRPSGRASAKLSWVLNGRHSGAVLSVMGGKLPLYGSTIQDDLWVLFLLTTFQNRGQISMYLPSFAYKLSVPMSLE